MNLSSANAIACWSIIVPKFVVKTLIELEIKSQMFAMLMTFVYWITFLPRLVVIGLMEWEIKPLLFSTPLLTGM